MQKELLELLAYTEADLIEIEQEEEYAIVILDKQSHELALELDRVMTEILQELDKVETNLEALERLNLAYREVLLKKYEVDKQMLIASETIATVELEELTGGK